MSDKDKKNTIHANAGNRMIDKQTDVYKRGPADIRSLFYWIEYSLIVDKQITS